MLSIGKEKTSTSGDLAFVDTNVLVYALEPSPSHKKEAAKKLVGSLLDEERICLSTQVLQELFATLTRKVPRPFSPSEALKHLDHCAAWPLFVVDYHAIREAGILSDQARLSFWDALIVVSASRSGAKLLYTEDLNSGQTILGVRVANPFESIH